MIPLFKFVPIRVPSWLVHSPCPETPPLPIPPASPLPSFAFACIPVHRGCSCLHLSPLRLIAHAPQTNNQSLIVNREIPCSPDPLMPLSLFFCLLSPGFCLLPKPPIPPILPLVLFCLFSISCKFVSLRGSFLFWWLRGYKSIMQNKPNFQNPKLSQPPTPQRLTPLFRSPPPPKNKPNQTQLVAAKPLAKPDSPDTPPRTNQYAIRDTRYAIRIARPPSLPSVLTSQSGSGILAQAAQMGRWYPVQLSIATVVAHCFVAKGSR